MAGSAPVTWHHGPEGHLGIVDRKKDMILRNGYNVYPCEVKEMLLARPAITNAAVFRVPEERHGREIVA